MQFSTVALAGLFALGVVAAPNHNDKHYHKDLDHALAKYKYAAFCEKLVGRQYKKTTTVKTEVVKPTTKYSHKKVVVTVKKGTTTVTRKTLIKEKRKTTITKTLTKKWGKTTSTKTLPCAVPNVPTVNRNQAGAPADLNAPASPAAPAAPAEKDEVEGDETEGGDVEGDETEGGNVEGDETEGGDAEGDETDDAEVAAVERRSYDKDWPSNLRKWKHDDVRAACKRFLKPSGTKTVTFTKTKYWPTIYKQIPVTTKKTVPKKTRTSWDKKTITHTETKYRAKTTVVPAYTSTVVKACPLVPANPIRV